MNHNSKKNFKNVCVENWEKVKDSYNCLANDTLWKKIKLESKVNNLILINFCSLFLFLKLSIKNSKEAQPKSLATELPKLGTNPIPFQPMTPQTFYPNTNMMYPPMGMSVPAQPNYGYATNMYMQPQTYGYNNMGYDYSGGYQTTGAYMNPVIY